MNGDLLSELLNDILTCACSALDDLCGNSTQCGCPCRIFLSAGVPVQDLAACCSDGQLGIYIARIYPHGNFPSQASGVNICQTPLAADVILTLDRCWSAVVKEDGSAPTGPEIEAASVPLYRDLYVLTKGVLCCLASKGRHQMFTFQGSQIVPPSGGCARVEVKFAVQLIDPLP